jgi:hypothetical protein
MKKITAKLGNMRKVQDWVVYPRQEGSDRGVVIQCDNRICSFDPDTGKGMLSDGKGGHQGFHKLNAFLGAKEITVPDEVRLAAIEATPKKGDTIGGGVVRIG